MREVFSEILLRNIAADRVTVSSGPRLSDVQRYVPNARNKVPIEILLKG